MNIWFRQLALLAAIGCVALTSCRPHAKYEPLPETGATLEGTVTYGSEPVPAALIIVAGDNGSAQGSIGDDGRYVVNNAPVGQVKIAVNTAAAARANMGAKAPKGPPKGSVNVPGKYSDPMQSGITTTVNSGSNTFNIVIPK